MSKKRNLKIKDLAAGQYNLKLFFKKGGALDVEGKVVEHKRGNCLIVTTHNSPKKKRSFGPGTKIWQKNEKK